MTDTKQQNNGGYQRLKDNYIGVIVISFTIFCALYIIQKYIINQDIIKQDLTNQDIINQSLINLK